MSSVVRVRVSEAFEAGVWSVVILDVKETCCLITHHYDLFYQAPKERKIVVTRIRVENRGTFTAIPFSYKPLPGQFSVPKLITHVNKEYDDHFLNLCKCEKRYFVA
jgi:hypothetical protein